MSKKSVTYDSATVVTASPVTVFYDGDTAADAVPVNHLAPGIASVSVGQRVTVVFYGSVAVIAMAY